MYTIPQTFVAPNPAMTSLFTVTILLLLASLHGAQSRNGQNLEAARAFLEDYDKRAAETFHNRHIAAWAYETNITDHNEKIAAAASVATSLFKKEAAKNCSKFDWRNFQDDNVRRQFMIISRDVGLGSLPKKEIEEAEDLLNNLGKIFSTAQVCEKDQCHTRSPYLTRLFAVDRDWNKLKWAWEAWRNASGRKMKKDFERFNVLQNKAARLNGYQDVGDYWKSDFETDDFEEKIEGLWQTVKPLYQQLHAFVRRRLQQLYKGNEFPKEGHIPAHILGNLWSQQWNEIIEHVKPYPEATAANITAALLNKGINVTGLLRMAEDFFLSLGFEPMTDAFWQRSMFEKPTDGRKAVCHASAWHFYNDYDFRLKQCTEITDAWLKTIHHEMGHIAYYQQYKDQLIVFWDGAHKGFHEAVGDVIALSVMTPEHLHAVGMLDTVPNNTEADLNFLMNQALAKVAFLPFGFLMDQWRWSVFRGDTTPHHYNRDWWGLRCKYQGISPPVVRTDDDFDPGSKFHIANNRVSYIKYFLSHILQFQFHKGLCEAANNRNPLHRCDIYRSTAAGEKLRNMLKLGRSIPWPQALKQVTGTEHMDAQPLMDYFKPLYDWLKKENEGEEVGWEESCPEGLLLLSDNAVKGLANVYIVLFLTLVALVF